MSTKMSFGKFTEQLYAELHALSTESKRRNSDVKHASDKSIEILKTIHNFEDLPRHPDFVTPFVLSCASKNAKLTTISMQCLQKLSSVDCVPEERIEDVLDAFIDSTRLAVEIQLKVLQIIPLFFKTYSAVVTGKLCAKLLQCCSDLLQLPNKAPMVAGTASATLQQLINDILERGLMKQEHKPFQVAVSNTEYISVDAFRFDSNRLFNDLCSLKSSTYGSKDSILDIENIPEDYGLEILESVLKNHQILFECCDDLQFLLRTKAVPVFLRSISSSKVFPIVVRSARCLLLLIRTEFLKTLELELEIILYLLVNILSNEIESPVWKKIVSLEIFLQVCRNFDLIMGIFKSYDMLADRKNILKSLLGAFKSLLTETEYYGFLKEVPVLTSGDVPIISQESSVAKIPLVDLLDKSSAPLVDQTYIIYLILAVTNSISEGIGSQTVALYQQQFNVQELDVIKSMFNAMFEDLFFIHRSFLYSSALDTSLFHSVVRAFQKLSHSAGVLKLEVKLNKCLALFGTATVESCASNTNLSEADRNDNNVNSASTVFHTISDSLMGNASQPRDGSESKPFHFRSIHQRNVSVFRALISLSVSLGPEFSPESWKIVLITWQWVSFYMDCQSRDYDANTYATNSSHGPRASNQDINAAKSSIAKLYESTHHYSSSSFFTMASSVIEQSSNCVALAESSSEVDSLKQTEWQRPTDDDGMLVNCIYNKDFYIIQLGEFSRANISRLFEEGKWQTSWDLIIGFLIGEAASRKHASESLRLCASDVLNGMISIAASIPGETTVPQKVDSEIVQRRLLEALMSLIDTIMCLGYKRDDLHNGSIETECDIFFQTLSTLKGVLDVFGDSLKSSWDIVFKIINFPFKVISQSSSYQVTDHQEDSSILDVIASKHKSLIQVSFDVFKLIFDDFLRTLPLEVVGDVIDTLLNFVRQDADLNISFSSISQFWLIGDYLRTCLSQVPQEFTSLERAAFVEDIEGGKLLETICSSDKGSYGLYYGLWLYLLKKLVECTNDNRLEVKSGAIQTFFRIIDSHSSSFPPWELIIHEVIAPLLKHDVSSDDYAESAEYINLQLKGLIQMYVLYFSQFSRNPNFVDAWALLIEHMKDVVKLPSFELSFVVWTNLQSLLQAAVDIEDLPERVVSDLYQLWCGGKVVYVDSSRTSDSRNKTNYDCVEELLNCYPHLHQLLCNESLLDTKKVENILSVLNSAARYPLLPEFSADHQKPSSLQGATLRCIKVFQLNQPLEIELLLLEHISIVVSLPFEIRNRIEMKLGPKMNTLSKKRIPSFEAISYDACNQLLLRVES